MNDDIKKLAAELVKSPHWRWMRGMSVRTTRTAGFPPTPAGTSVVLESAEDLDDHICEGRFGALEPEPHHSDPEFGAKADRHDASVERARTAAVPDLDDPLTAAGLLLMFRDAYGDPTAHVTPGFVAWARLDGDPAYDGVGEGDTETEALARAILAAPTNKEIP